MNLPLLHLNFGIKIAHLSSSLDRKTDSSKIMCCVINKTKWDNLSNREGHARHDKMWSSQAYMSGTMPKYYHVGRILGKNGSGSNIHGRNDKT